jgi:AGZA family xanthine/uracil permease-like MFS transporter
LLSTLAGIALGFIGMGFLFRIYARPVVGLSTLGVVLLTYFGRVRFRGGLPGGLVAVCLGCALSWAMGLAPVGSAPDAPLTLRLPHLALGEIAGGLAEGMALTYFSVILPMGLFNLIGSLQNLESAKAAGDDYPEPQSLAVNGAGTLVAAAFGSCFPTTLYIGHPGWKSMGARSGYSSLNALFFLAIALSGSLGLIAWAIPLDAGIAIVLWIGIVITAQAFQATPKHHAPAVVIGLLPGVAAWGTLMAKNGLRAGGVGAPGGPSFGPDLLERFLATDTWIEGAFALEQGFIFTAMILTSATVAVIERQFCRAALWCCAGAAGSLTGLMHSFQFSPADVVLHLVPATRWAVGYLAMAAVFLLARWVTVASDTGRS